MRQKHTSVCHIIRVVSDVKLLTLICHFLSEFFYVIFYAHKTFWSNKLWEEISQVCFKLFHFNVLVLLLLLTVLW